MITSKQRFVLAVLLLVAPFAFAQQSGRITGTVFDDARKPLVGASVAVANTTRGVSTSSDGKFEIVASPNETLVISYLGYATQEIRVDSRTRIDVTLEPQANLIEDLVVVGYGVQKRVNVTGAVSSVNYAKEAESRPVTSTAQLLQGMNAGLMVSQTSGQPGQEGMLMRIRGIGTLNNSAPLVIVDGFESSIANVSPDDIESVSVLKDAASCAIYGNRGANGVVLVTTKTGGGNAGKFNISYNGMVAFNRPANHFGVVSNYADYMELMNESAENIDGTLPFSQAMIDLWREKEKDPNGIADSGYPNYVAYPNTDWMEAMFENNVYHKHNLSASGSSGGTKYLMSFSYVNNPGVVARTGTERFQLRTNVSSQVTKWLEIGTKLWGYEGTRELSDFSGASGYMSRATPGIYPYYDGKYGWMENSEQSSSSRNNLYFINRVGGEEKSHYVNAAIFANVKLPYRIRYNVSFNYARSSSEHKYYGKTCNAFSFSKNDWAYRYEDLSKLALTQTDMGTYRWTFQNNLSWDYTFAEKHDLTALVGFEAMYSNTSNLKAKKTGFAQDKLVEFDTATTVTSIDGTQTDFATASFFGRLTYAYDNRYLFETNLRYDGSSRFARKSRWGLFPSASAAWRISEEPFFGNAKDLVDNLKLRASFGSLGNQNVSSYYTYMRLITNKDFSNYTFDGSIKGKYSSLGAPVASDLTWETAQQWDLGLDLTMLNNRLNFTGDVYIRDTKDMLTDGIALPAVYGASLPDMNTADLRTKGYELTVNWRDQFQLAGKPFEYSVGFNISDYKSVITKYDNPNKSFDKDYYEGMEIGEIWGFVTDGFFKTDEEAKAYAKEVDLSYSSGRLTGGWLAGDLKFVDLNGDGFWNEGGKTVDQPGDRKILGNSRPTFSYGINASIRWMGFDASVFFQGTGNHYWYPNGQTMNFWGCYSASYLSFMPIDFHGKVWSEDNPDAYFPRPRAYSATGGYLAKVNDHYLQNIRYLRLKNLTVGYTIPVSLTKKAGIDQIRVYFSGENLAYWSPLKKNTKYVDPEAAINRSSHAEFNRVYYPWPKTFMFGIDVTF